MDFQTKIAESRKDAAESLALFLKTAGMPPPLPAAARGLGGALGRVAGGVMRPAAHAGVPAIVAGAGTGFSKAPALNPFKTAAEYVGAVDAAAVRKRIEEKYPDMKKSASLEFFKEAGSLMARLAGGGATAHKAEIAGLGVLAAPVGYELHKNIRAGNKGDAVANATELGGLGVLAAPAMAALRHGTH